MDASHSVGRHIPLEANDWRDRAHGTGAPMQHAPAIAFVFPGLGGELFERFHELESSSETFRRIIERADAATLARLGRPISELVRVGMPPADARSRTRRLFRAPVPGKAPATVVAHSILYTLECALAQAWMDWGVRPQYVSGYSLGELAAACVAGLFDFETGLSLVIGRAEILADLPETGMIAVSGPLEEISPHLDADVHVVAANSQSQTVLGSHEAALEKATLTLREQGYLVQRLPVEHAFHTPLMRPAAARIAELFSSIETGALARPLASTLTGELVDAQQLRDPAHWVRHLCEPVRFVAAVDTLDRLGVRVFLETGPGQALSALIEGRFRSRPDIAIVTSMPAEYDTCSAAAHLSRTAGRLASLGVPVRGLPMEDVRTGGSLPPVEVRSPPSPADVRLPETSADEATTDKIRAIWSEILERASVAPDDDLFALGGNSLKTARIGMRIKRDLGVELTLRDIYSAATPRGLAALISAGQKLRANTTDLLTLPNGLTIRCQSRAEAAYFYQSIFAERSYLRHGLAIGPGATVVDVGANIGMFSMFAALEAPGVRLYSIEPVAPLFEILRFNLADVCEDAVLVNVGISDAPGQSVITYYPNSPGMSSFASDRRDEEAVLEAILRNSQALGDAASGEILRDRADFMESRFQEQQLSCELRTLSAVLEEQGIEVVDLLKIDVQKLEMQVLKGISEHHWDRIRQVVLEVHDQDGRVEAARALLQSRGFQVIVEQDHLYQSTGIYNLYATRVNQRMSA